MKKSNKMSYRPSSAHRQTSINPITGEKIDYSNKTRFTKDQAIPMYVNLLLNLYYLIKIILLFPLAFHH